MSKANITTTDRKVPVSAALVNAEDVSVALLDAHSDLDLDEDVLNDAFRYVVEHIDPDAIDDALYSVVQPLLQEWANLGDE